MLTILTAQQTFDQALLTLVSPLEFEKGVIYNLTGPNGCGKTTLLELMAHIQRGEVKMRMNGRALEHRDESYCSKICYVSVHDPLPDITVKDYFSQNQYQILPEIKHLLDHRISRLSTGETQWLRLLPLTQAEGAEFIYLDEPFNGLDTSRVERVRTCLKQQADNGAIVIYTSHILNHTEVEVACDQCIQIHTL
jgi:ABC-type multidrug transport system ATPase subunit